MRAASEYVNEVANASEEQRAGIEQVNGAIVEMDRVTQQNAALVEQAAAAAMAMQEQAAELAQVVGTFRLEREASRTRPARLHAADLPSLSDYPTLAPARQ